MVDLEEVNTNHRSIVYAHPDSDSIQDMLLLEGGLPARGNNYFSVTVDVTNLSNQTTFKTFKKIDFINYIQDKTTIYPDDYNVEIKGVNFLLDGTGGDMKITIQSTIQEGSQKDLDISYGETKR